MNPSDSAAASVEAGHGGAVEQLELILSTKLSGAQRSSLSKDEDLISGNPCSAEGFDRHPVYDAYGKSTLRPCPTCRAPARAWCSRRDDGRVKYAPCLARVVTRDDFDAGADANWVGAP